MGGEEEGGAVDAEPNKKRANTHISTQQVSLGGGGIAQNMIKHGARTKE